MVPMVASVDVHCDTRGRQMLTGRRWLSVEGAACLKRLSNKQRMLDPLFHHRLDPRLASARTRLSTNVGRQLGSKKVSIGTTHLVDGHHMRQLDWVCLGEAQTVPVTLRCTAYSRPLTAVHCVCATGL